MIERKEVGKRLHAMRLRKYPALSMSAFALKADISKGSVGPVERGESFPMLHVLERWLVACDSSLREFFGAPSKSEFDVDFDYDPDHVDVYAMVATVLGGNVPDLAGALRISVEAFAEKAARAAPQSLRGKGGSAKEGSMKHSERIRRNA